MEVIDCLQIAEVPTIKTETVDLTFPLVAEQLTSDNDLLVAWCVHVIEEVIFTERFDHLVSDLIVSSQMAVWFFLVGSGHHSFMVGADKVCVRLFRLKVRMYVVPNQQRLRITGWLPVAFQLG